MSNNGENLPKEIELLSDLDIQSADDDYLGLSNYKGILTGVVKGATDPFTIGIFSEWGNGKTSLMKMMKEELTKEPEIIPVWFNAWQYEQEEGISFSLLAIIRSEVKEATKGEISKFLTNMRKIMSGTTIKVKFPFIEAIFQMHENKHRAYRKALENLSVPSGKKIVVFIDDLDRCNPKKAVNILELKLEQSCRLLLLSPRSKNRASTLCFKRRERNLSRNFTG